MKQYLQNLGIRAYQTILAMLSVIRASFAKIFDFICSKIKTPSLVCSKCLKKIQPKKTTKKKIVARGRPRKNTHF